MTEDPGRVTLRRDGGIAWITLERPRRLNAFAGRMREELAEAVDTAANDGAVRVIVITGAGRAFCAGADVEVLADLLARDDEETFRGMVEAGKRAVRSIRAAPQPVVAALNGVAAGAGASLAAACDLRVASEAASVGFTFNRIGLHPDWGATHYLPRLVGAGRAAELILTARMLDAREAERIGFVQRLYPAEGFRESVEAFAAELAAKPPLALSQAKHTLAAWGEALEDALTREGEAQLACFRSRDVREGVAAFLDKREPGFSGR